MPKFCLALSALIILVSSQSSASILIGSRVYSDNAFADAVGNIDDPNNGFVSSVDTGSGFQVEPTFNANRVLGSDINSAIICINRSVLPGPRCTIEILFTDNALTNSVGADFSVFENGLNENFEITIAGHTETILSTEFGFLTNSAGGTSIDVADIDLSRFGIALGDSVNSLTLTIIDFAGNSEGADIVAIGELTQVAEPANIVFFGLGLIGLVRMQRRRSICRHN